MSNWRQILEDAGAVSLFEEVIRGAHDAGKHGAPINNPGAHARFLRDQLAYAMPAFDALSGQANAERDALIDGLRLIVREAETFADQDGIGAGTMARNLLERVGQS